MARVEIFSAGGDLKFILENRSDPEVVRSLIEGLGRALNLIGTLPIPVVAAVGFCLAGGFELMQACDFAVAAEDAVIGDGHVEFAQLPGGGGAVRLVRQLGRQAALGILLTGDQVHRGGGRLFFLIHRAFPADRFEEGVAQLAVQLAQRGRGALQAIKQTVIELEPLSLDQALRWQSARRASRTSQARLPARGSSGSSRERGAGRPDAFARQRLERRQPGATQDN